MVAEGMLIIRLDPRRNTPCSLIHTTLLDNYWNQPPEFGVHRYTGGWTVHRKNDVLLATGNCVRKIKLPGPYTDVHEHVFDGFFEKMQPWVLCASIKTAVIGVIKCL